MIALILMVYKDKLDYSKQECDVDTLNSKSVYFRLHQTQSLIIQMFC